MGRYDALLVRGRLRPHHRVLIHSATGAVGLAATRIALSRGCEVRGGFCPCIFSFYNLMHVDACSGACEGCHAFVRRILPVGST